MPTDPILSHVWWRGKFSRFPLNHCNFCVRAVCWSNADVMPGSWIIFFPFKRKCLVNILGGFSWVEQGEPGPHCSCWCWSLLESLVVLVLLALGELGVMLPVLWSHQFSGACRAVQNQFLDGKLPETRQMLHKGLLVIAGVSAWGLIWHQSAAAALDKPQQNSCLLLINKLQYLVQKEISKPALVCWRKLNLGSSFTSLNPSLFDLF